MVAKSKKSCPASSSNISCTSNDSSSGFVGNQPQVKVPQVRARRGRPPKNGGTEKDEKKTILSWIIDCNIVQECAAVCYVHTNADQQPLKAVCYVHTSADQQPLKIGRITRAGIICNCCIQVLTIENFQYHTVGEVDRPYEHIIVMETNNSLLCCMFKAWNLPSEMARHQDNLIKGVGDYNDTYDDACMICADGGELMCCERENCHSTHHHRCMDMENVPSSAWFCPYCVCKFCRNPAREGEHLLTCPQCEKKCHWECHQDWDPIHIDINSTPIRSTPISPFCEQACKEIYDKLEKMVGVSYKLDGGYTWTLLRRMEEEGTAAEAQDYYMRTECHAKLVIAWSLMKDCFEPITDRHTKIDVLQSIVYNCGSNYTRINFRGFHTAVLEKDGEIITVASLRIHGTKLAEMPLIATNAIHRRKGMCRMLMSAIESALCFLNVGYLIIPSVRRKAKTWIEGYNFRHLEAEMKKEMMGYNTLMFHDSIRLQKVMTPPDNGQVAREAEINAGSQSRNLGINLNQELMDNSE